MTKDRQSSGVDKGPAVLYRTPMPAHAEAFYTRQQISALTGVGDGALSFWIKKGLLVPTSGGEGKGSHRKFAAMQVCVAALLGELQSYGVNIARLQSFAAIAQDGIRLSARAPIHPSNWDDAASLRDDLHAYRQGASVEVRLSANRYQHRPANNEAEIVEHHGSMIDHDTPEALLAFANTLPLGSYESLLLAYMIWCEMAEDTGADWSMTLWQDAAGRWRFSTSPEPGDAPDVPAGLRSAIVLGVGQIIRDVWGIDLAARERRAQLARAVKLLTKDPDQTLTFYPEEVEDEARRIIAAGSG